MVGKEDYDKNCKGNRCGTLYYLENSAKGKDKQPQLSEIFRSLGAINLAKNSIELQHKKIINKKNYLLNNILFI